jgi:vacuolar protein sorting-associated protein 13A/C
MEKATFFVSFYREERKWPFRIDNNSKVQVFYYQKGSDNKYCVDPLESQYYAWDYPSIDDKMIEIDVLGSKRLVRLTQLGRSKPFRYAVL